jgi:hypothetical protein
MAKNISDTIRDYLETTNHPSYKDYAKWAEIKGLSVAVYPHYYGVAKKVSTPKVTKAPKNSKEISYDSILKNLSTKVNLDLSVESEEVSDFKKFAKYLIDTMTKGYIKFEDDITIQFSKIEKAVAKANKNLEVFSEWATEFKLATGIQTEVELEILDEVCYGAFNLSL